MNSRRSRTAGTQALRACLAAGLLAALSACSDDVRASDDAPVELPAGEDEGAFVTLRHSNGEPAARGRERDGRREGEWTFWREDGSVRWQGNYLGGVLEGEERGWYPQGGPWFEGARRAGLREGLYRSWHENGRLEQETHFRADLREGACTRYDLDGRLDPRESGRYEAGRRIGDL